MKEIVCVAQVLSTFYNVPGPNRDAKRSFALLLEWFHKNWSTIRPLLPKVNLLDENFKPINFQREILDSMQ